MRHRSTAFARRVSADAHAGDRGDQLRGIDRLGEMHREIRRAAPACDPPSARMPSARSTASARRSARCRMTLEQLVAIHPRHADVADHHVRATRLEGGQRLVGAAGGDDHARRYPAGSARSVRARPAGHQRPARGCPSSSCTPRRWRRLRGDRGCCRSAARRASWATSSGRCTFAVVPATRARRSRPRPARRAAPPGS